MTTVSAHCTAIGNTQTQSTGTTFISINTAVNGRFIHLYSITYKVIHCLLYQQAATANSVSLS